MSSITPSADLPSFHTHLLRSNRILTLLGAGLSAASGLPTFRGAGGLWRTHDAVSLATPGAFARNPSLVWQFYSYRRHMALQAQPNAAHYALAELAKRKEGVMVLSQNVDGLSQRAGHPAETLLLLHGTLFTVKCVDQARCGYSEANYTDPIVPALALPSSGQDPTATNNQPDISDASIPLPPIPLHALPICPRCDAHLLRPGVVWFGESLPSDVLSRVDAFLSAERHEEEGPIDLMLVIGTSAQVFPAAGYIEDARRRGARVCVVNLEGEQDHAAPPGGWKEGDWYFGGDAAVWVPRLLEPIVGRIRGGGDDARGAEEGEM